MIGNQIQNYKIISLLGEGGMGDVYLAEHLSINRKVAIKVLKPELFKNEEIRKRFKNEAFMLAHLQHPNIVGLIDYIEQEDGLFLTMEYIEGQDLAELVKAQEAPINIDRAKKLMIQILEAFKYAHQNGIIHRDVKPSNILITAEDQIKVLDFGIAKLVGDTKHNLTKTGTQIGTVYYMSPEQVKGKVLDKRSDIYSLGVTFYELLSGVCPYRGMTTEYEIYDSIVKEPLLPLTTTMGEAYSKVWNVIEKATEKEVENRFQNCQEFIDSLEKDILKKEKSAVKKEIVADQVYPTNKTNKSKLIIVISIISVVVFGSIFFLLNERNVQSDTNSLNQNDLNEAGENYQFDAESNILNFLLAEDSRDFDKVYSFYSENLRRYNSFNYPSYTELKDDYIKSWGRTSYSKNTIQNIEKIDDFTFDVYTDFEFLQYNHEDSKNVNSVLRFVLDKDGKIVELFGIN